MISLKAIFPSVVDDPAPVILASSHGGTYRNDDFSGLHGADRCGGRNHGFADHSFGRMLQLLCAASAVRHLQRQVVPPQYRTVEETVMVAPGATIAHRTPAQYRTVMVPQTVMVAPEGVQYEQVPPQYAMRQRVEMVAPAREYYVAVPPRCNSCGY